MQKLRAFRPSPPHYGCQILVGVDIDGDADGTTAEEENQIGADKLHYVLLNQFSRIERTPPFRPH